MATESFRILPAKISARAEYEVFVTSLPLGRMNDFTSLSMSSSSAGPQFVSCAHHANTPPGRIYHFSAPARISERTGRRHISFRENIFSETIPRNREAGACFLSAAFAPQAPACVRLKHLIGDEHQTGCSFWSNQPGMTGASVLQATETRDGPLLQAAIKDLPQCKL